MGNQLVWNQRYDIGVDIIDNEHQRLFQIINNLLSLGKEKRTRISRDSVYSGIFRSVSVWDSPYRCSI